MPCERSLRGNAVQRAFDQARNSVAPGSYQVRAPSPGVPRLTETIFSVRYLLRVSFIPAKISSAVMGAQRRSRLHGTLRLDPERQLREGNE